MPRLLSVRLRHSVRVSRRSSHNSVRSRRFLCVGLLAVSVGVCFGALCRGPGSLCRRLRFVSGPSFLCRGPALCRAFVSRLNDLCFGVRCQPELPSACEPAPHGPQLAPLIRHRPHSHPRATHRSACPACTACHPGVPALPPIRSSRVPRPALRASSHPTPRVSLPFPLHAAQARMLHPIRMPALERATQPALRLPEPQLLSDSSHPQLPSSRHHGPPSITAGPNSHLL